MKQSEREEYELIHYTMKKFLISALTLPLLIMNSQEVAIAGSFSQDLSGCLINSTSNREKLVLNKWMARLWSEHPEMVDVINISYDEKRQLDKKVGGLYTKLLTERCKEQTEKVIKYEGYNSLQRAFRPLGGASSQELMRNPDVKKSAESFVQYMDLTGLNQY